MYLVGFHINLANSSFRLCLLGDQHSPPPYLSSWETEGVAATVFSSWTPSGFFDSSAQNGGREGGAKPKLAWRYLIGAERVESRDIRMKFNVAYLIIHRCPWDHQKPAKKQLSRQIERKEGDIIHIRVAQGLVEDLECHSRVRVRYC